MDREVWLVGRLAEGWLIGCLMFDGCVYWLIGA